MKKHAIKKMLLIILIAVLKMNVSYADSHVWLAIDIPNTKPVEGSHFSTPLIISSWNGSPGALDLTIQYDPTVLRLTNFIISEDSPFNNNYFVDSTTNLGQWRIACFQLENTQDWDSIQTIGTITWFVHDALNGTTDIDLDMKELVESSWNPVEVYAFGQHIEFFPNDITIIPSTIKLGRNYPNPFNYYTIIEYHVPKETNVTIEVYNISGQHITTLVNEVKPKGNYKTSWKGKDNYGYTVTSGVYIYQLKAGSIVKSNKMLFLK